jgi:hypothetical protein
VLRRCSDKVCFAHCKQQESGFGSLLVINPLTQKLFSIFDCQFNRIKATRKRGAARTLTRLNWRAQNWSSARLFGAVKDCEATASRREASFTASNRHFKIETEFWDKQSLHQNSS